MKLFKTLLAPALVFILLFTAGSQFSACKKTVTVTDTVIIKDSLARLKNGLVGWYTFTNGSLQDSSGNNNNIVFNSAVKTADRFGNANNAYLFDGASSYMKVSNSASLNPANITLTATVRVNAFYKGSCAGNEIMAKGYPDNINGLYIMRFNSNTGCGNAPDTTKEFFLGAYGDNVSGGPGTFVNADSVFIKTGQWYNLVFTYDGFEGRFYINGILKNIVLKTSPFHANTNDVFIGKSEYSLYPYYFNGAIDEIRIYNRALSIDEVAMLNALKQ